MENDPLAVGDERRPARGVLAHRPMPMHAGGRARTSGDAQTRLISVGDEPEFGNRAEHRARVLFVEPDDQEGPPRREPEPARSKHPRALDQEEKSTGVDLAERRRGADDDAPAIFLHAEKVA